MTPRNAAMIARLVLSYFEANPLAEIKEHEIKECACTIDEHRQFDAVIDELCDAGYLQPTITVYTHRPALCLLPAGARALCSLS